MTDYKKITDSELKNALKGYVISYKENNKKSADIKRKNFNHIDETSSDYYLFKQYDRQAYHCLRQIIKIKNYKSGKGYYGKTAQDQAREYCKLNY